MKRTTPVSLCAKVLAVLFVLATAACAQELKPQEKAPEKLSTPVAQTVVKGPKVTFVELGSVNCIPCKAMKVVMDSLEIRYPQDLKIVFHDVWTAAGRPAGREYNIRSIPTQIFLDADGVEFFRHEGYFPMAELVKILEMKQVSK